MSKLLIFLIIPAVLSRAITTQPPQKEDASILGYQFLSAFVKAARADDYSIFAPNFRAPIYAQNLTQIGESTKEAFFKVLQGILQGIPEDTNIEQLFPRNQLKFDVDQDGGKPYLFIVKNEEEVQIVFAVDISGENQILEQVSFVVLSADTPAGLIKKLI